MSIVLVGNGPSAIHRDLGNIINDFMTVVRFNCFKTNGYENQVGSRTDIWVCNVAHDTFQCVDNNDHEYDTLRIIRDHRIPLYKQISDKYQRIFMHCVGNNISFDFMDSEVCSKSLGYGNCGIATTGTLAMWYYIQQSIPVSIYGFDILEPTPDPKHYFDVGKQNLNTTHRPQWEAKWINKQIEEGMIEVL